MWSGGSGCRSICPKRRTSGSVRPWRPTQTPWPTMRAGRSISPVTTRIPAASTCRRRAGRLSTTAWWAMSQSSSTAISSEGWTGPLWERSTSSPLGRTSGAWGYCCMPPSGGRGMATRPWSCCWSGPSSPTTFPSCETTLKLGVTPPCPSTGPPVSGRWEPSGAGDLAGKLRSPSWS